MHKFTEELTNKYLTKVINRKVCETFQREFDEVFAHFKKRKPTNDTTLGATCREIERRAKESIEINFGDFMNEVTDKMGIVRATVTKNPFAEIAYQLWIDFLDRYDIRGIISSAIGEEWSEKREELEKAGIIDEEGDAI